MRKYSSASRIENPIFTRLYSFYLSISQNQRTFDFESKQANNETSR